MTPPDSPNASAMVAKPRTWLVLVSGPILLWLMALFLELPLSERDKSIFAAAALGLLYTLTSLFLIQVIDLPLMPQWLKQLSKLYWKSYLVLALLFGFSLLVLRLFTPSNLNITGVLLNLIYGPVLIWAVAMLIALKKSQALVKSIPIEHTDNIKKLFGEVLLVMLAYLGFVGIIWLLTRSIQSSYLALAAVPIALTLGTPVCIQNLDDKTKLLKLLPLCVPVAILLWVILSAIWPKNWNSQFLFFASMTVLMVCTNVIRQKRAQSFEVQVKDIQKKLESLNSQTPPDYKPRLEQIDNNLLSLRKQIVEYREEGILDEPRSDK